MGNTFSDCIVGNNGDGSDRLPPPPVSFISTKGKMTEEYYDEDSQVRLTIESGDASATTTSEQIRAEDTLPSYDDHEDDEDAEEGEDDDGGASSGASASSSSASSASASTSSASLDEFDPSSPWNAILELAEDYEFDSSSQSCPFPKVADASDDYRAFCVLVHPRHGLLLLHCSRKKNKPPHHQLPGGHVDAEDFDLYEGQLYLAGRAGASREVWEETHMDLRFAPALDRLLPLVLYPSKKKRKFSPQKKRGGSSSPRRKRREDEDDTTLPNEYKGRLFFVAAIDDEDFLDRPDPAKALARSASGEALWLHLSVEHSGFRFEKDPYRAMELLQLHSGGKVSKALAMAVDTATGGFFDVGGSNTTTSVGSSRRDRGSSNSHMAMPVASASTSEDKGERRSEKSTKQKKKESSTSQAPKGKSQNEAPASKKKTKSSSTAGPRSSSFPKAILLDEGVGGPRSPPRAVLLEDRAEVYAMSSSKSPPASGRSSRANTPNRTNRPSSPASATNNNKKVDMPVAAGTPEVPDLDTSKDEEVHDVSPARVAAKDSTKNASTLAINPLSSRKSSPRPVQQHEKEDKSSDFVLAKQQEEDDEDESNVRITISQSRDKEEIDIEPLPMVDTDTTTASFTQEEEPEASEPSWHNKDRDVMTATDKQGRRHDVEPVPISPPSSDSAPLPVKEMDEKVPPVTSDEDVPMDETADSSADLMPAILNVTLEQLQLDETIPQDEDEHDNAIQNLLKDFSGEDEIMQQREQDEALFNSTLEAEASPQATDQHVPTWAEEEALLRAELQVARVVAEKYATKQARNQDEELEFKARLWAFQEAERQEMEAAELQRAIDQGRVEVEFSPAPEAFPDELVFPNLRRLAKSASQEEEDEAVHDILEEFMGTATKEQEREEQETAKKVSKELPASVSPPRHVASPQHTSPWRNHREELKQRASYSASPPPSISSPQHTRSPPAQAAASPSRSATRKLRASYASSPSRALSSPQHVSSPPTQLNTSRSHPDKMNLGANFVTSTPRHAASPHRLSARSPAEGVISPSQHPEKMNLRASYSEILKKKREQEELEKRQAEEEFERVQQAKEAERLQSILRLEQERKQQLEEQRRADEQENIERQRQAEEALERAQHAKENERRQSILRMEQERWQQQEEQRREDERAELERRRQTEEAQRAKETERRQSIQRLEQERKQRQMQQRRADEREDLERQRQAKEGLEQRAQQAKETERRQSFQRVEQERKQQQEVQRRADERVDKERRSSEAEFVSAQQGKTADRILSIQKLEQERAKRRWSEQQTKVPHHQRPTSRLSQTDPIDRDEPGAIRSFAGAAASDDDEAPSVFRGKSLLVLLSSTSGDLSQKNKQERALVMLGSSHIQPEIVDGSHPSQRDLRNHLFSISGIRGNYPQFFLKDVAADKYSFVGNFDVIESMNDEGPLEELFG